MGLIHCPFFIIMSKYFKLKVFIERSQTLKIYDLLLNYLAIPSKALSYLTMFISFILSEHLRKNIYLLWLTPQFLSIFLPNSCRDFHSYHRSGLMRNSYLFLLYFFLQLLNQFLQSSNLLLQVLILEEYLLHHDFLILHLQLCKLIESPLQPLKQCYQH